MMGKPTKSIPNECVGAMTRLNVLCFRLSHIYHVDRRDDRLAFARGSVGIYCWQTYCILFNPETDFKQRKNPGSRLRSPCPVKSVNLRQSTCGLCFSCRIIQLVKVWEHGGETWVVERGRWHSISKLENEWVEVSWSDSQQYQPYMHTKTNSIRWV